MEIENLNNQPSEIQVRVRRKYHGPVITGPDEVYRNAKHIWQQVFRDIDMRERMVMFPVNQANEILGYYEVSIGGTAGTLVDPVIVFKVLFNLANAKGFVLVHNHPTGRLYPSDSDDKITNKLSKAANTLDVNFLDHLIISNEGYYSYSNEGKIL